MRHRTMTHRLENTGTLEILDALEPGKQVTAFENPDSRVSRMPDDVAGSLVGSHQECQMRAPIGILDIRRQPHHSSEGWDSGSGAERRSQGWSGVSDPLSLQGERAGVRVLRVGYGGCHAERSAAESKHLSGAWCRGNPLWVPAWPTSPPGRGRRACAAGEGGPCRAPLAGALLGPPRPVQWRWYTRRRSVREDWKPG